MELSANAKVIVSLDNYTLISIALIGLGLIYAYKVM